MRLSVVGTVHAESGQANVVELQAILERLKPDVIFAEIPSTDIDEYRDGSRGGLESIAVARYRESNQAAVVPVDLAKPQDGFFRDAREMFAKVERTSPDYRRMIDRHSLYTRLEGFPYLNSDRCLQAWTVIYAEVLATLDWIRDPRLREIYDLWKEHNELRDGAMLMNIADYAFHNGFVHGVFLVGAAHRKSIVDKVRVTMGTGALRADWERGILFLTRT